MRREQQHESVPAATPPHHDPDLLRDQPDRVPRPEPGAGAPRGTGGRRRGEQRPGGTLGEVPLFDASTYPATAVAATGVECLVVPADVLTRAMQADVRLAMRLLARLAGRVRHVIARLDDANAKSVTERLAHYLSARLTAGDGGIVSLGMTQADLAEELGTVREVLVRALRSLRTSGVVEPAGRGRLRIVRLSRLRAIGRTVE